MSDPVVTYIHLSYEQFKKFEDQCKEFNETTHKTEGGFYHKSLRLDIGGAIWEFHGPLVGGYGHTTPKTGGARAPEEPFKVTRKECDLCGHIVTTGHLIPCLVGKEDGKARDECPYYKGTLT